MIELFDKMIIRLVFIALILLSLICYKFLYQLISTSKLFRKDEPISQLNESSIIVMFSRVIGISIIFSQANLQLDAGLLLGLVSLITKSFYSVVLYSASLYIIDSINLNHFEYHSEMGKKNNLIFALFSSVHAVGASFIIRSISHLNTYSIVIYFTLWLFAMVLISLATYSFRYFCKQTIESILVQQNTSGCFSYLGYFLSCSFILSGIVGTPLQTIQHYFGEVILKVLLAILILPIFFFFFEWAFNMKKPKSMSEFNLKFSLYYSLNTLSSSLLTLACIKNISYGVFYP